MKLHTDKHGLCETWQIHILGCFRHVSVWLCDERYDSNNVYHTGMVEQIVTDLFLQAGGKAGC